MSPMTSAERLRLEKLEALHPGGKHPDYAAKVHTHTNPEPPPPPPPPPPGPTYTFQDEFEGTVLKPHWQYLYGPGDTSDRIDTDMGGFGLSQISVANGIATIACERKQTPSGRAFAGGIMCTRTTFVQKYGTFEARLRYDEVQGGWPSWFLLPKGAYNPYPEFDIVEAMIDTDCLGPGYLEQIIHPAAGKPSIYDIVDVQFETGRPAHDWHTHKMVWTANRVDFSIDGKVTYSVTDPSKIPQIEMYPLFIYGVGIVDACRATPATPNRSVMQIDYIRVTAS